MCLRKIKKKEERRTEGRREGRRGKEERRSGYRKIAPAKFS